MIPFGILQPGYHKINLGNHWQFVTHMSKKQNVLTILLSADYIYLYTQPEILHSK